MLRYPLKSLDTVLPTRSGFLALTGVQSGGKACSLYMLRFSGGGLALIARLEGVGFQKLHLRGAGGRVMPVFEALPDDMAWGVPDLYIVRDDDFAKSNTTFPTFFRAYAEMLEKRAEHGPREAIEADDFGSRAAARQCAGILSAFTLGADDRAGGAFCARLAARVRGDPSLDAAEKNAIVAKIYAALATPGGRRR